MKLTQPMLYLGLGGTGCLVGTELERRLRDELCGPDGTALSTVDQSLRPFQLPPYIQFVYADLDESELARVRRRVVPSEEYLNASGLTQHISNKLVPPRFNSYPEVALSLRTGATDVTKEWLPPQIGEPRIAPLLKGAGQLPTVGRAALFETIRTGYDAVKSPLVEAIAGLAKSGGYLDAAGAEAKRVETCDAFVGFSIAGGTGAGIFYDYLHLIGDLFEQSQIKVQIHPLVLMPSAFDEKDGGGRHARLNAASALMDLFQLVDDQNAPDASALLGDRRTAEAVKATAHVTAYSGRRHHPLNSGWERVSVRYPDFSTTLRPATVQTAFLFSKTVAIEREDLHRSIASFILSMVGTELDNADDESPRQDQTHQSFAADFINHGVERQSGSYSGIGRRPVSTSLVASMTVPVDDLADLVSARLLARAVEEFVLPAPGGVERNRTDIEDFFANTKLDKLRTRDPENFQEPAPARGAQAVGQALYGRIRTMGTRLPVLAARLRSDVPRLARDFDYLNGIQQALLKMDPFRLSRVALGDPTLSDPADRAGFVGSVEERRKAPPAPNGLTVSEPPVEAPRRRFGHQPDWADPEVRKVIATQNAWFKWRTESIWNEAWSEHAHVWSPKIARLRAEIGGLVGAFLAHARNEPGNFDSRAKELYRSRTGVTYLLPPLGDLEVFYRSTVRRFLGRADLGLLPTSSEADIVNALVRKDNGGWRRAYDKVNIDSTAENRFENAVQHVRNLLKQEVKGLFVNRGVYGDQQPLLPALRDLLAKSAGKEGPAIGESELRTFQRGLAELLPAAYRPEGTGKLKILIAYPQASKDVLVERFIRDRLNFPDDADITVQFRAVDTESLTIVLLRTSMGISEVPELRRILTHWSGALQNELQQDFLAWRQRLGYDFHWLASTKSDRVRIMHHLLCAMWNGRVRFEGDARSPDRIIVSLPGDEPVSVALAVEPYGDVSSWADLVRAYEQWVFSNNARDEQIRPEFCQRLMQTYPDNIQRRPAPSKLFVWFVRKLMPHQIRTLRALEKVASADTLAWIRQLLDFWESTVDQGAAMPFQAARVRPGGSLYSMLEDFERGFPAVPGADLAGPEDEDGDGPQVEDALDDAPEGSVW